MTIPAKRYSETAKPTSGLITCPHGVRFPHECKDCLHDEGMWRIEVSEEAPYGLIVGRGGNDVIAEIQGNGQTLQEIMANARLIAAAPEMLAALELAAALFDNNHAIDRFNWGASGLRAEDIRELNEAPLIIRAAIRKAQGEL